MLTWSVAPSFLSTKNRNLYNCNFDRIKDLSKNTNQSETNSTQHTIYMAMNQYETIQKYIDQATWSVKYYKSKKFSTFLSKFSHF